jgi:hypothetical protein
VADGLGTGAQAVSLHVNTVYEQSLFTSLAMRLDSRTNRTDRILLRFAIRSRDRTGIRWSELGISTPS